ncbi:hypothetical protein [Burkholderia sp. THE68]|uniref:hypothetical protein n=1 Tax=Burkholderia sp. THE68 TaxID=758782 RepID=UPI0013894B37|nr:hypothetical protein [Burkholderia sp. THE68]
MPLLESEDLLAISREALARMAARLEEAERELDKRLFEESIAHFESMGYTADKLLSPEDLVDEVDETAGVHVPRKPGCQARRTSFFDVFGGLFAKRTKQVG